MTDQPFSDGLSLDAAAQLADVPADRAREWAEAGLLPAAAGFSLNDVGVLRLIRALLSEGHPLSELARAAQAGRFPDDYAAAPPPAVVTRGRPEQVDVTIAFADLAAFTPLTDVHGDAEAAAVLDRFAAAVRDVTASVGGAIVKQIGDAFMVVFSEPTTAVRWAVQLRSALQREARFPALHIGMNSGPTITQGEDYVGSVVNIAARLASLAGRNQILVTEATAGAMEPSPDWSGKSLGERSLRGIDRAMEVFEIVASRQAAPRVVDPVCGMELDADDAAAVLELDDGSYRFCSSACLQRFVSAPRS